MAGFVAANVLRGDVQLADVGDFLRPREDQYLLDVRTPEEVAEGTIAGATCIPLEELRQRLGELPSGREILVCCAVGLRGYLACRVLNQRGFRCRNLSGGYALYRLWTAANAMVRETGMASGGQN